MSSEDIDIKKQFSLQEFIVDFFGALMPGVLFVFFLIPSIFYSSYISLIILINLITKVNPIKTITPGIMLQYIKALPSVMVIAGFILLSRLRVFSQ